MVSSAYCALPAITNAKGACGTLLPGKAMSSAHDTIPSSAVKAGLAEDTLSVAANAKGMHQIYHLGLAAVDAPPTSASAKGTYSTPSPRAAGICVYSDLLSAPTSKGLLLSAPTPPGHTARHILGQPRPPFIAPLPLALTTRERTARRVLGQPCPLCIVFFL